jgi:hypothetical protein
LRSRRRVIVQSSSKGTLAILEDPNGPKETKRRSLKDQNHKGSSQPLKVKRLPKLHSKMIKVILTPQPLVGRLNALNFWERAYCI